MAETPTPTPEPTLPQRVMNFLEQDPDPPEAELTRRRTRDGGLEETPAEPEKPEIEAKAEKPEAESEKPEAEPEPEPEKPEPEADDDAGLQTFGEIAKHFDVEESVLADGITIPVGEAHLPISALVTSYQTSATRIQELESRGVAETESLHKEMRAKSDEKIQDLFAVTEQLVEHIRSEKKLTDEEWAALKDQDPMAYLAKKEELRERQTALDSSFQRLQQEATDRKQQEDRDYTKWVADQGVQLVAKMPDWVDEKVAKSALDDVTTYLKTQGFEDGEFQQLADHRLLVIAWQASEWSRLTSKKVKIKDAVRDAPRIIPSRARRAAPGKKDGLDRSMAALHKTGSDVDARRAMENLVDL